VQEYDGTAAKLTFPDGYVEDTGDWMCEAWNEAGEATQTTRVTIKGRAREKFRSHYNYSDVLQKNVAKRNVLANQPRRQRRRKTKSQARKNNAKKHSNSRKNKNLVRALDRSSLSFSHTSSP
jgi:hypothetical protein